MTNYREILRLAFLEYTQTAIAGSLKISRNTIREAIKRAKEKDLSWPLDETLSNQKLEELLYPERKQQMNVFCEPDFEYIHKELARPGVNLALLHAEYLVKEIEELQEQAGELQEQTEVLKTENAHLTEENIELKTDADNLSKETERLAKKKNQLNKEFKKSAMTKKNFEQDVWEYRNAKKWQLPEPGIIMSAKAYRDKMAEPLVAKLINVIETLTLKCQNLLGEVERLSGLLYKRDDEIDRLKRKSFIR